MTSFDALLDSSVLISIAQTNHTHHIPSLELWRLLESKRVAVSTHAIAETYAILTALPPSFRLSPRKAEGAIHEFLKHAHAISLSTDDYLNALEQTARSGHSSGMIYDALHLACARKCNADQIYTWNVRHFRTLAPDLAHKILAP